MSWMRRSSPFVTLAVCGPIVFTLMLPPRVRAQEGESSSDWQTAEGVYNEGTRSDLSSQLSQEGVKGPQGVEVPGDQAVRALAGAIPQGGAGGAQPQATALPSGPGSISGMGESFSAQLSTGTVSMGVPFTLPAARGRVQPRLDLAYSSGGGFGLAGYGWSLGMGSISRQTYQGVPSYDDRATFHPAQDRFMFGGAELVPICVVQGRSCAGAQAGEVMPVWASGWQYFRTRIEGGFLRIFWSPDHRTWRAQAKDGTNLEFGLPLDGTSYEGALERNPERAEEVYRWYLARQYDNQGVIDVGEPRPVNTIVYRYFSDGGAVYLSDIFDTSPAQQPTTSDLSLYAHHVALRYEPRPDRAVSYRAGFRMEYALRAAGIDVASKPFAGGDPTRAQRELVRRYDFRYDESTHTSLLVAVVGQGRCAAPVYENAEQELPPTECPALPPLEFSYQRVQSSEGALTDGNGLAFEPFASRVRTLENSPPYSLGQRDVGTLDANNDGLVDILVTDAGAFKGRHGLYLNGDDGALGYKRVEYVDVDPLRGVDASVLRFSNVNVSPLDLDADGRVDFVHMPKVLNYEIFSLEHDGRGYVWSGRPVTTAGLQDPKINFARDSRDTRTMDVNGDGLIDIVYTSPTELQTFFGLGGFPGGDGQFGQGRWTGPASAALTTEPVRTCAPWSAQALRFSDPDVRIADMNGDGLVDLVRLRDGQLVYWPGRGNGFFGTGHRDDCAPGGFGAKRHVEVAHAPRFGVNHSGVLHLGDVNGDGLADVVEIKSTAVDIYLNENGESFTDRTTIDGVPFLPPGAGWGTLTDIDGSGTLDVVWGHAHEYKYMDLTGGVAPYLLTGTSNGLGRSMELSYRAGTELAREARTAGQPWQSHAPVATSVVVSSTVRDHLGRLGRPEGVYRTEYSYRDAVFDNREREFRGFREATTRAAGDGTSPTVLSRSRFLLGECSEADLPGVEASCGAPNRWRDDARDALKGFPYVEETFDERGIYLTTGHNTFELRKLYTGLDGRRVVTALPVAKDTFIYDTSSFDAVRRNVSLETVRVQLDGVTRRESYDVQLKASARVAHIRTNSTTDMFGNTTEAREEGCVEGCPGGVDEVIVARSEVALVPGDTSGWLWREQSSYIVGSVHTDRRQEMRHEYDPRGNRLRSYATLRGTLPLDRFHAAGGDIAPPPSGQSGGMGASSAEIKVTENHYDPFGNLDQKRGPTGACTSSVSDAPYAQLIVAATSQVGRVGSDGCGQTELTQHVLYDRGLAVPVESISPLNERTRFAFDGFGRLSSVTVGHPTTPGALAARVSAIFTYDLPSNWRARPYSITHAYTQDGADNNSGVYRESYTFVDGLGRPLATISEADPSVGDGGDWVVSGRADYNAKGQVIRACDPYFFTGDVFSLPWTQPTATDCQTDEFDSFGRPLASYRYDGLLQNYQRYGALTADGFDAADLEPGPRQNTFTTTVVDGHGRQIGSIERVRFNGQIEKREHLAEYLPTGQVERVTDRRPGSPDTLRWLRYDSLGRLVLNVEPNTSIGFTSLTNAAASSVKALRYAYDDAGQLVGASDARGCGSNYFYDAGGRLVAEDYSPCAAGQAAYTAPNLSTGDGTEVFIRYDAVDPEATGIVDGAGRAFAVDASRFLGRIASMSDRAKTTVFRYDVQGRSTGTALRLARPGEARASLAARYAPRWYTVEAGLDALDRPTRVTTGATVPELMGADGTSEVRFSYAKNGATRRIDSSYGTLFSGARYLADGRVRDVTMGDAAATQRAFSYDENHRSQTVQSFRSNLAMWSATGAVGSYVPPAGLDDPTTQMLLEDYEYSYDRVGGIIAISDHRDPADWPASAQPVHREFDYDDSYRITEVRYIYPSGQRAWQSPFAAENADEARVQPMPHQAFAQRVAKQTFAYDHLGNMTSSDDDSHAFWDRSTGVRVHGADTQGPHQLRSASNRGSFPGSALRGDLDVRYDPAGQVTDLLVRREGECLPAGSSCFQRFHYDWDEIGNLTRARRWDLGVAAGERISLASLDATPSEAPPTSGLFHWYQAGRCTSAPYISCEDIQGNGSAGNGSPGRTPRVVPRALSGHAALVPDGGMAQGPTAGVTPATPVNSEYTMSFVAAIDGDGPQQLWSHDTYLSATDRNRVYLQISDVASGSRLAWRAHPHYGVGAQETPTNLEASVPRGRPFVTTIRATSSSTELYIDGVLAATGGPTIPTALAGYFGYGHAMRMGEALMYSRPLEANELTQLHTYLRERYDVGGSAQRVPERQADADLRYAYSGTERVLKTALGDDDIERHTLYIFPTLEVRGAEWSGSDYALDPTGVSLRLHAGPVVARVIHAEQDLPSLSSSAQHVFLQFADHLGSTTFSIDHASGELVEFSTYQAYGGTESDYRPGRWASFREPYKFGGKEEDIEVGLMYFGARYYSPYAAIWLSTDPVTIHELGSDRNPYAYVGGSPIMNVDPDGRELCTLAVLGIIAAVSAVVAATTSVTVQAVQNGGIDEVEWGLQGVAGAALAGAVSGFAGGAAGLGAGAVAGAGLGAAGASTAGAAFGAAVIGGAVGGAVGGASGYLTSAGVGGSVGGRRFRGAAFGKAVGLGALSGAVSGSVGGGISWAGGESLTAGLVGSVAGAGASYGVGAAIDGRFSALDMVASLGGSVAGVLANQGAIAALGGARASQPAAEQSGEAVGGEASGSWKAFELASQVVKAGGTLAKWAAKNYPKIRNPVTGKLIPFPKGSLAVTPGRVAGSYRAAYIRAYEKIHGPQGAKFWSSVEIHHIKPLNHGGTNEVSNLIHLTPAEHSQFTRFWANYKYIDTKGLLNIVGEGAIDMLIPRGIPMPSIIFISPEILQRMDGGPGGA